MPYLLKNVNCILLRVLRANKLFVSKLSVFNSSTLFWSRFQKMTLYYYG